MNPYEAVETFEQRLSEYTGAPYVIAVDSCTHAVFLTLEYQKEQFRKQGLPLPILSFPKKCYLSVPMAALNSGYKIQFEDRTWIGQFAIKPLNVFDCAKRFHKDMFHSIVNERSKEDLPEVFGCLSFHSQKNLPIGKGGAILTNSTRAARILKLMRYEGRKGVTLHAENPNRLGWNMTMTPEQAVRGLLLLLYSKDINPDLQENYPDVSRYTVFQNHPNVIK